MQQGYSAHFGVCPEKFYAWSRIGQSESCEETAFLNDAERFDLEWLPEKVVSAGEVLKIAVADAQ